MADIAAASPTPARPPGPRLESVDLLRGLVMVLMALDHARDFFHFGAWHGLDPLDLNRTTAAVFCTRWITHYCAPTFILLAGAGAFLSHTRGRSTRELSWFLLTRGVWLVGLEMTFVQWIGWTFAIDGHAHFALVLWAIGWSMIALAALVHLPASWVAAFGVAMIALHNTCDGINSAALGAWAPLWTVLHEGGRVELGGGHALLAGYPLIPWIGVMAGGYGLGACFQHEPAARRRRLWQLGAALTAGFVGLRLGNLYGNPRPWSVQPDALRTLFSFLDCHKYPPSLCYLLMTLGPVLLLLAWWDRGVPTWMRPLLVFGRVPMFFYLLHIPLLHGLAVLVARLRWGRADWLYGVAPARPPDTGGFGLLGVYSAWLAAVVLLYFACRWFAELKRRHRSPWLSYL
jgi:uncharacterized membrane protein